MIEPFALLYPWLRDALDDAQLVLAIAEPDENDPRPALDARDVGDHLLDCTHGPTRYAVLRALADAGHARPWALGAPWSPLTDEQGGRATAEILRAVGEDPGKPAGVVPVCVLSGWGTPDRFYCRRRTIAGVDATVSASDLHGWCVRIMATDRGDYGPVGGLQHDRFESLQRLAVTAARSMGCLMIEDLTPT